MGNQEFRKHFDLGDAKLICSATAYDSLQSLLNRAYEIPELLENVVYVFETHNGNICKVQLTEISVEDKVENVE